MNKKTNLLHLSIGLGVGGAEKVIYDLALNNDDSKVNVYVRSLLKNSTSLLDKFKNSGINTETLGFTKNPLSIIKGIITLYKLVSKEKIDIVHAHMYHGFIVAFIIKILKPSIKIVFTYHASATQRYIREFFLYVLRPFRNVDIIFSEDSKEYFVKNSYRVIPNGIKVENYKSNQDKFNKFTFISVARLEDSKNHKSLINICKSIKNKDYQILIAGQGYLETELKSLVKENNLDDKIRFLGVRDDIPELLSKSHAFVLPSIREGLPIVLLEAGASTLPIISTKVGSIPLLLDETNSYMCNIENFPRMMTYVIDNYEESVLKALKLREKIESEFSIISIYEQHKKIYLDLVK